jgi:YbbR domain-containing protein
MMKKFDSNNYFRSRPFLFFVSLGVSVLLWFFVASGRDRGISRDLAVPLELHNLSRELVILGAPETVEVRIAGSAAQLSRLAPKNVHAFVNLQNLHPGDYTLPVRAEIPPTFELREIKPSEVSLRLVAMESRTFVPQLRVMGDFSEGVSLLRTEMEPREVVVTAPKGVLEGLSEVVAEIYSRNLEAREGDVLYPVSLKPRGDFLRPPELLRIEPSQVSLSFTLSRKIERKLVTVSPVFEGEISEDYRMEEMRISPEKVLLSGPPGSLEAILSVDTEPVNLQGATGDMTYTSRVVLPPGEKLTAEPREVTVLLKVVPRMHEKVLHHIPVEVRGRSIYPQWEILPPHITVYLQGPQKALDLVTSETLEAFVDVTNLVSRKISVPLRVSTGVAGVSVLRTDPENATVYAKIDD